jgi:5'-deoxynucleotidase
MFHFYAMLSRMKLIYRWGLMRNTRSENLCEHSFETAVIAHALAVLRNTRFGGNTDPERAALLALYHDASEIFTGDLPTPVKYFNPEIHAAYRKVETVAQNKLLTMLPDDLKPCYESIFHATGEGDRELLPLIKAADKLSAIIKCMEEKGTGNSEFSKAEATLRQAVKNMHLPEADCFMEEFLPSYALTLDEQD